MPDLRSRAPIPYGLKSESDARNLRIAGRACIEEHSAPELDAEHGENRIGGIRCPGLGLLLELTHSLEIKEPSISYGRFGEGVVDQGAERIVEPHTQRDAETRFRAVDDVVRKHAFHGLLQDPL